MWVWLSKIIYYNSKVANRRVYFDTNCYRSIARNFNRAAIDNLTKKMRRKEKCRNIDVRLSYLVASEMFAHLGDPPANLTYSECKLGLYTAMKHIERDGSKMLPNSDSELHHFIFGTIPQAEVIKEQSLFTLLRHLAQYNFDDGQIQPRTAQFNVTSAYLQTLKDGWIDSITDYFIKKHDPAFVGGWQVFAQDAVRRTTLLNEINAAVASGGIYREFGAGAWLYVVNNFNQHQAQLDEPMLQSIIARFKPIFDLQIHIMRNLCQGGYNLQRRQNDITDYLIITSLNTSNTVFVSNETNQLVPRLHGFGYTDQVITLNDYFESLGMKERV